MIADPATNLTQRQLEFIALYASGSDMEAIAQAKFVSRETVKNTLARARKRVGADSLAHLCSLCVEAQVITRNGTGFMPVVDPYVAE